MVGYIYRFEVLMKIAKEFLRESARLALAERGYSRVEIAHGPGIVPGARLTAVKDGATKLIAVRTSSDREVGLLRNENGNWRTIPKVDLVLVAVPADEAAAADVFAFDKDVLLNVFNATVDVVEKNKRSKSRFKAPVFVALDDVKNFRTGRVQLGLKARALWQVQIPLSRSALASVSGGTGATRAELIERLKREMAEFAGVDISKIILEIRIIG
jgi:hypothetical protein